jgi:hypothetical protein
VATFDREKGRQVIEHGRAAAPTTIFELHRRLTDPNEQVVGTLDADGSVLLSSDSQRIEELLGRAGERYRLSNVGGRWVLARPLEGNRMLTGWLAVNPQNPARPLAKFEVVSFRVKVNEGSRPAVKEARKLSDVRSQ